VVKRDARQLWPCDRLPTFGESRRECPDDGASAHRAAGACPDFAPGQRRLRDATCCLAYAGIGRRVATAGEIANDRCTMPDTTLRNRRWGNELSFVSTCCLMHDDVACGAGEVSLQMAAKARVTVERAEHELFFGPSVGCRVEVQVVRRSLSAGRVPGERSRDRDPAGDEEGPLDVGPILVGQATNQGANPRSPGQRDVIKIQRAQPARHRRSSIRLPFRALRSFASQVLR
jgi:hypothetical protein